MWKVSIWFGVFSSTTQLDQDLFFQVDEHLHIGQEGWLTRLEEKAEPAEINLAAAHCFADKSALSGNNISHSGLLSTAKACGKLIRH